MVTTLVSFGMERENLGEEATLSAFLEEVALVSDIDTVAKDDNRVLLMTLHSAKGLEFSNVYLSGLEDGIFPSYMAITSDELEDIEEERRLAYVGITRAKEDLTITYAKARMIKGENQYNAVSRFVREIPDKLLDSKIPGVNQWDVQDYDNRNSFEGQFYSLNRGNGGAKRFVEREELSDTVFDKPRNNWEAAEQVLKPSRQQTNVAAKRVIRAGVGADVTKTSVIRTDAPQSDSTRRPVTKLSTGQNIAKPIEQHNTTSSTVKKHLSEILVSRPKAVVKKKETPAANKPYIAKSLEGLTKGMPILENGSLGYDIGDRVSHVKYGDGTVLNIVQDIRDFKVTVNFDAYGNKIMYAAFAKLQKI